MDGDFAPVVQRIEWRPPKPQIEVRFLTGAVSIMAVLYILQSERDGRFYVGSTVDLQSRIRHHRGGFTHSTKRFGKFRLAFTQEYATLAMARSIEHKLKRMKRRDFVEKIIRDGSITMAPDNEE